MGGDRRHGNGPCCPKCLAASLLVFNIGRVRRDEENHVKGSVITTTRLESCGIGAALVL